MGQLGQNEYVFSPALTGEETIQVSFYQTLLVESYPDENTIKMSEWFDITSQTVHHSAQLAIKDLRTIMSAYVPYQRNRESNSRQVNTSRRF